MTTATNIANQPEAPRIANHVAFCNCVLCHVTPPHADDCGCRNCEFVRVCTEGAQS